MTTKKRFTVLSMLCFAAAGSAQHALAIELLTAGDFEATVSGGEVPGWVLEEYRSASPTTAVNSAALAGFANNPGGTMGESGLWLRAFVGNPTDGLADAILSQTVPATPGETYTFSGEAAFEGNYAGGVAFLDPLSPFGAIESPTKTEFELAFLDAGGAVIGAPLVKNVADDVFNGLGYSAITPLMGMAPANAASVRVRAMGRDLAFNIDPSQTAFLDNFSLKAASAASTELLVNANLNMVPPTIEEVLGEYFEFVESPDTADILQIAGFANNTATGGANGIWVRPFIEGESAAVQQTVAGSAGTEYTFKASTRWEVNFLPDSGAGENETLLELAFPDAGGEVLSTSTLDLRSAGQTADNAWHTYSVNGTAPAGTTDVRVAGIINNLSPNTENGANQSAFWDDFSLMVATGVLEGDYNSDGFVNAADYTVWRDGDSPDSSPAGYTTWANNYGASNVAPSVAIPEPTSALLLVIASVATLGATRRQLR